METFTVYEPDTDDFDVTASVLNAIANREMGNAKVRRLVEGDIHMLLHTIVAHPDAFCIKLWPDNPRCRRHSISYMIKADRFMCFKDGSSYWYIQVQPYDTASLLDESKMTIL